MLRQIEIAAVRIRDVRQGALETWGLCFEFQKRGPRGLGETILQCICRDRRALCCPACAIKDQLLRA
eukprot:2319209-Lingulodinium_polyedra.AAC.1